MKKVEKRLLLGRAHSRLTSWRQDHSSRPPERMGARAASRRLGLLHQGQAVRLGTEVHAVPSVLRPLRFSHVTPAGHLTKIILGHSSGSVLVLSKTHQCTYRGVPNSEAGDRMHAKPQDPRVARSLTYERFVVQSRPRNSLKLSRVHCSDPRLGHEICFGQMGAVITRSGHRA